MDQQYNPANKPQTSTSQEQECLVPSSEFQPENIYSYNIGRTEDPKLAYLMGAIFAGRRKSLSTVKVEFYNKRTKILLFIKDILNEYFPEIKVVSGQTESSGKIFIQSTQLRNTFNTHTALMNDIPWHMLGTKAEKTAFLRGVFAFAGGIDNAKGRITLDFRAGRRAGLQLAMLLTEVGIMPNIVRAHGSGGISIEDSGGLRKFHELGLFTDPMKQETLNKACRRFSGRVGTDPETYFRYERFREENPNMNLSEISRELNIHRSTLAHWEKSGPPPSVKRMLLLKKEIAKDAKSFKFPEPACMLFLYRELGYSLSISRNISTELNLHELKSTILLAEKLNIQIKESPQSLTSLYKSNREILNDLTNSSHEKTDHQVAILAWSKKNGFNAETYSSLTEQIVNRYLEKLGPYIINIFRRSGMYKSGIDLEAAQQVAAITIFKCINTFNPQKNDDFLRYLRGPVKCELYKELAKVSRKMSKTLRIARVLNSRVLQSVTTEEVMERFRCTRNTALRAINLSNSYAVQEETPMEINDDYASSENNTLKEVENRELMEKIMELASKAERRLIKEKYIMGKSNAEIAKLFKTTERHVEYAWQKFLKKARINLEID